MPWRHDVAPRKAPLSDSSRTERTGFRDKVEAATRSRPHQRSARCEAIDHAGLAVQPRVASFDGESPERWLSKQPALHLRELQERSGLPIWTRVLSRGALNDLPHGIYGQNTISNASES